MIRKQISLNLGGLGVLVALLGLAYWLNTGSRAVPRWSNTCLAGVKRSRRKRREIIYGSDERLRRGVQSHRHPTDGGLLRLSLRSKAVRWHPQAWPYQGVVRQLEGSSASPFQWPSRSPHCLVLEDTFGGASTWPSDDVSYFPPLDRPRQLSIMCASGEMASCPTW